MPNLKTISAFSVYGLQAVTNEQKESHLEQAAIPTLWHKLTTEIYPEINTAINFYAIFTDYQDNVTEDYTLIMGADHSPTVATDDPIVVAQIPAGRYLVFEKRGKALETVLKLWIEAEDYFNAQECEYKRAFENDFEEYIDFSLDGCLVRLYIKIKE